MEKKKNKHARFYKLIQQLPDYDPKYRDVIKESIVHEYSLGATTSLTELYEKKPKTYSYMLEMLQKKVGKKVYKDEQDTARKRLIAAIGANLDKQGYSYDSQDQKLEYIKRIACRAANSNEFNQIPLSRLRALYNMYIRQNKVLDNVLNLNINRN